MSTRPAGIFLALTVGALLLSACGSASDPVGSSLGTVGGSPTSTPITVHAALPGEPTLLQPVDYDYLDVDGESDEAQTLTTSVSAVNEGMPGAVTGASAHYVGHEGATSNVVLYRWAFKPGIKVSSPDLLNMAWLWLMRDDPQGPAAQRATIQGRTVQFKSWWNTRGDAVETVVGWCDEMGSTVVWGDRQPDAVAFAAALLGGGAQEVAALTPASPSART